MEKQFKNGLVLGKMYPFHLGHKYLIDTAISYCETVHVMVCSLEREKISGQLRYEWVRSVYKDTPNVHIIHCEDENPQYTSECATVDDFYNDYWIPTVYKNIKELDAVFTSEDYGDEFAKYLKVQHVLVDKSRNTFPVSGTAVRNNPYDNWEYIDNNVKKYFTKKVVVLGPESVGKSTMVRQLAEYFNTEYVDEYGRTYTELVGTDNLQIFDFENIALRHHNNIYNRIPCKLLFIDTDALTTKVFANMYLDNCESEVIDLLINLQSFDLCLVLSDEVPWIDDGTRDFPNNRVNHFNTIIESLNNVGRPYITITGTEYEDRFNKALKEVKKLL